MINEIEKTFFDTFGVEPKFVISLEDWERYKILPRAEELFKHYPQITDHILLELICILNPYCYPSGENIQHLKEGILEWCIKYKEEIKHQVRTLFEDE